MRYLIDVRQDIRQDIRLGVCLSTCGFEQQDYQQHTQGEEQPNVPDPNSKTNLSGKCGFKTYSV